MTPCPSWYLDPLVAEQKRAVHQELIRSWTGADFTGTLLKTDSFEEAFGQDQILFDLFASPFLALAIDANCGTVRAARALSPLPRAWFFAADVRALPLPPESVDLIVSTSTLDHLESRKEFVGALENLAAVLRPGGRLIITLDNWNNPLYHLLRWMTRSNRSPFRLGYTTNLSGLEQALRGAGLEVIATSRLIHNPRVVSTLLFLALRRTAGPHADGVIRFLLACFDRLGRTPLRPFTACFVAACARKAPPSSEPTPAGSGATFPLL